MKKLKLTLLIIASLFFATSMMGQVTETFVAVTGSNYQTNLTKVDWNWNRMWVEDNTATPKVTHGIIQFDVANVVSQEVSSATFKFHFEKIATGDLPATVEIYYKEPYTGYMAGEVNYPEGCTVLGSIELTTAGDYYQLANDDLKAYVKAQIDAGEKAVLFMRSVTPDVKLSIIGLLGGGIDYPTLDVEMPTAATFAPLATVKTAGTASKDFFLAANDTVILDFSKPMDMTSVEAKFMVEPAATSSAFTWSGDTMAYVVCSGLTKMSETMFTVAAGAMALDGTATKSELTNTFYTVSDNVIKSESNFWNMDNTGTGAASKTNALSVAYSDSTDVFHKRSSFIYLDLAGTTSDTDFKGIMLKCFDQQDANGWVKGLIAEDNQDYVLYDVDFAVFGGSFTDAGTMTKIDDILIDSIYTVYTFDSQAILDYLADNAGEQVCIAILDETPTESASLPTIWISDPSNNPVQGAPVVLFDDAESASLSTSTSQQVTLYPQPVVGGEFTISGADVMSVEIYSTVGRKMTAAVTDNTVDVSGFNTGIYFVKMNTTEGQIVKQIIVD